MIPRTRLLQETEFLLEAGASNVVPRKRKHAEAMRAVQQPLQPALPASQAASDRQRRGGTREGSSSSSSSNSSSSSSDEEAGELDEAGAAEQDEEADKTAAVLALGMLGGPQPEQELTAPTAQQQARQRREEDTSQRDQRAAQCSQRLAVLAAPQLASGRRHKRRAGPAASLAATDAPTEAAVREAAAIIPANNWPRTHTQHAQHAFMQQQATMVADGIAGAQQQQQPETVVAGAIASTQQQQRQQPSTAGGSAAAQPQQQQLQRQPPAVTGAAASAQQPLQPQHAVVAGGAAPRPPTCLTAALADTTATMGRLAAAAAPRLELAGHQEAAQNIRSLLGALHSSGCLTDHHVSSAQTIGLLPAEDSQRTAAAAAAQQHKLPQRRRSGLTLLVSELIDAVLSRTPDLARALRTWLVSQGIYSF